MTYTKVLILCIRDKSFTSLVNIIFWMPHDLPLLLVTRPYYAKVSAQDRDGNGFEAEGEELIARCFCHELDHLDGIVYTQVMDRYLTEEELAGDDE